MSLTSRNRGRARLRWLLVAVMVGFSLPASAEEGPPATSPGVPAGPPYTSLLPQPADTDVDVALEMCFVTMAAVPVSEAHARRYVPAEYALGRNVFRHLVGVFDTGGEAASETATVAVWDLACDLADGPDGAAGKARLSFVTVQVSSPGNPAAISTPNIWSHYVLWAHTDNRALAGTLHAAGVPIEVVDTFRFDSQRSLDDISVASAATPYRQTNNATVDDVVFGPHDHANEFWFGSGAEATVLRARMHYARDLDCVLTVQPDCRGEIDSPAGSPVADLLGSAHVVTRFALRHHKVPVANVTIGRSTSK